MTTRALLVVIIVAIGASAPAAQTPGTSKPVAPPPSKTFEVKILPHPPHTRQADDPKNPYRDLFEPQKQWWVQVSPVSPQNVILSHEPPRVVCGMTLIPVNPNIDPGIVKVPDLETRYAIRAIKPPVCLPH